MLRNFLAIAFAMAVAHLAAAAPIERSTNTTTSDMPLAELRIEHGVLEMAHKQVGVRFARHPNLIGTVVVPMDTDLGEITRCRSTRDGLVCREVADLAPVAALDNFRLAIEPAVRTYDPDKPMKGASFRWNGGKAFIGTAIPVETDLDGRLVQPDLGDTWWGDVFTFAADDEIIIRPAVQSGSSSDPCPCGPGFCICVEVTIIITGRNRFEVVSAFGNQLAGP